MQKYSLLLLIGLLFIAVDDIALAQQALRIGEWGKHLPTTRGSYVTQTPNNIVYVSEQNLFFINKEDGSTSILSKTNGLNDVDLRFVRYREDLQTLAIVYGNSNIDLIIDGRIRNFNQIRNNPNIVGDKTVFDVAFNKEGNLFLACGFGLVELNISRREFGFTTFTPVPVLDFAHFGDYYYMATQEGLYRVFLPSVSNLADFSRWEYVDEELGIPSGLAVQELAVHNNKLYVGISSSMYVLEEEEDFQLLVNRPGFSVLYFSEEASELIIGWNCSGCPNQVQFLESNGNFVNAPSFCVENPRYAIQDPIRGDIWLADLNRDYRKLNGGIRGDCERITPNSIYSSNASDIAVHADRIYVASGGMQINSGNLFREDGFFIFENEEWSAFNKFNVPEFGQRDIRDFLRVRLHPNRDTLFVGIYYDGVLKWTSKDEFVIYDEFNSTLRRGVGDSNRIRIAGMAWDADQNLWIGQFDGANPISVYRNDGTWRSFSVPGSINLMDVIIDRFDHKWFRVHNGGLLIFNEGRDMDDESDFRFRYVSTTNSLLPSNFVTCLAVDLDGAVWVGTDSGILIMECGSDPFRPECRGSERFLVQDGFGAILFEGQNITSIAIDGGNRKWIGTTSGLFVQSPEGDEPVYNFTTRNSPLLDDNITAITIDDVTGLVYVATNRGIQIFRAEATGGTGSFREEVYAFPNPVRPDYDGPIAIKGLARDANVKIADADGRLVFEGRAVGGQAIWDGRDLSGRQVQTGVYLVFATYTRNEQFPQTHVTKIMVVR